MNMFKSCWYSSAAIAWPQSTKWYLKTIQTQTRSVNSLQLLTLVRKIYIAVFSHSIYIQLFFSESFLLWLLFYYFIYDLLLFIYRYGIVDPQPRTRQLLHSQQDHLSRWINPPGCWTGTHTIRWLDARIRFDWGHSSQINAMLSPRKHQITTKK